MLFIFIVFVIATLFICVFVVKSTPLLPRHGARRGGRRRGLGPKNFTGFQTGVGTNLVCTAGPLGSFN